MKMSKKAVLWIVIVLVVVLGGVGYSYYDYLRTYALEHPKFASGNGRLEATEIHVATKLAGRLVKLNVSEGDLVKKGDLLAYIQKDSYEAKIAQAKAQIEVKKAEFEAAKAIVEQKKSTLEGAKKEYERVDKMHKSNAATQRNLDDAEAIYKAKQAECTAAMADVKQKEAAVKSAEADLKLIEVDLADCDLYAPQNGRIQFKVAEEGEMLAAGGRVLNLVDLEDAYIVFFLPEVVSGQVAIGADVLIFLDAIKEFFLPAKITYVSSVAQFTPKTVETQVERQKMMFRVKAHVDARLLRRYIEHVKTGLPGVAYVKVDKNAKWSESPVADRLNAMNVDLDSKSLEDIVTEFLEKDVETYRDAVKKTGYQKAQKALDVQEKLNKVEQKLESGKAEAVQKAEEVKAGVKAEVAKTVESVKIEVKSAEAPKAEVKPAEAPKGEAAK